MKAADKYSKQVNELLKDIALASAWNESIGAQVSELRRVLRASRWSERSRARERLWLAEEALRKKHKTNLRLIQGGNDFLARRSRAVLTLIVTSEANANQKVG